MNSFKELAKYVMDGNEAETALLCEQLISSKVPVADIIDKGLVKGMDYVGELFTNGQKFIPEVIMSVRALNSGLQVLRPFMNENHLQFKSTAVIGTVKGDIHNVGKSLVAMMIRSAGFQVVDLGTDVSAEEFVRAVRESGANVVALSAMLTTAMTNMKEVVKALQSEDFGYPLCIIVGGAPVTKRYAQEIDAHFADTAIRSRDQAIEFVAKQTKN